VPDIRSLLNLAGAVALLLWGVHMAQSGVQRAFGSDLRRLLARALSSRVKAAAAGVPAVRPTPALSPFATFEAEESGRGF
jgi:hypothetical protein